MPITHEERRVIDAAITERFLRDNRNLVRRLTENFAAWMDASGFRYYLKGGNAIAILNGGDADHISGDFDFQLQLPEADYRIWAGIFDQRDRELIHVLKHTVDAAAEEPGIERFHTECFQPDIIRELVRGRGIRLDGLTYVERHNDIMCIGRRFGEMSYIDVDRYGGGGRIEERGLANVSDIEFSEAGAGFGPSVYVNYTIPGFILYRMVYSCQYEMDGERFNLKSEIIDLSLPRLGSAEVHISQEGVVTFFRDSGLPEYPFRIPGWGYHLYENINLLQEIVLGVSGSPHKKRKRVERLQMALEVLERANNRNGRPCLDDILKERIHEPSNNHTYEGPYGEILGYYGALAYNISDYRNAYSREAMEGVRHSIYHNIISYYKNLCIWWGTRYEDWERVVYFKTDPKIDLTFRTADEVKRCAARFIAGYTRLSHEHPGVRIGMEEGADYQYISPLFAGDEVSFPFDYFVVQIAAKPIGGGEDLYGGFKEFCRRTVSRQFTDYGDAFTCVIHEMGDVRLKVKRVYAAVFQRYAGIRLPAADAHVKEFLIQSILESQRCPLAEVFQR